MDNIFEGINGKFVIPYLDGIIIFSKDEIEHHEHLRIVMKRLYDAGITLNRKKCNFIRTEIEILGSIISESVIKPDKEKKKAINEFRRPSNIKELRSFLGLANYCRGFIPNLSKMEEPLNKLLKGESKRSTKTICWEENEITAFESIRKSLSKETIRAQLNFKRQFILTTDASDNVYRGILSQLDEKDMERIIYAYSKTMDAKRNYSIITDKEPLAIIKSVKHFRRYLLGKKFILKTDHKALTYLSEAKNPSSRMLRWALKLQ